MTDQLHSALKELAPDSVPTPGWSDLESRVARARMRYRLQVAAASVGAVVLAGAAIFGLAQVNLGGDVIDKPDEPAATVTTVVTPTTQMSPSPGEPEAPTALPLELTVIGNPLEAAQAFIAAVGTRDWELVTSLLSDESRSSFFPAVGEPGGPATYADLLRDDNLEFRSRYGMSGERFVVIEFDEDTRIVALGEYAEDIIDSTSALTLVRENGGWFVELDSSTQNPRFIRRPAAFELFQIIELEPASTVEWESIVDLLGPMPGVADGEERSASWRAYFEDQKLDTSTVVSETSAPHVSVSTLPDFRPDGGPYFLTLVIEWGAVDGPRFLDVAVFAVNQPPGVPQTSGG